MPGERLNLRDGAADITPAIEILIQTYTDNIPYPHKFNDALLKCTLTNLDFAVRQNLWQEHADHEVETLRPILEMIGSWIPEKGKDRALYGMFEGNSCNYQLFEKIEISEGQRLFQCPYKEMIEITSVLGTQQIVWEDVCSKWCTPLWKGFAKVIGIEIDITPGETCCVKLAE